MEKMEGKMNKMEKNSSEKLLRQLIATLRMEGSLVSASLGESDKYNIIVINGESLTGEDMGMHRAYRIVGSKFHAYFKLAACGHSAVGNVEISVRLSRSVQRREEERRYHHEHSGG
mgnify:CR=1 FL=1